MRLHIIRAIALRLTARAVPACAAIALTLVAAVPLFTISADADPAAHGAAHAPPLIRVNDPYSPNGGRIEGDRWVPKRDDRGVERDLEPPVPTERYRDPDVRERYPRRPEPVERERLREDDRRYDDRDRRTDRDRDIRPTPRYGRSYTPPPRIDDERRARYAEEPPLRDNGYSESEIVSAGHRFFGKVSQGLAKAVQRLFKRSGRPNGYILGEDAGGAFVAGLRYGEGRLYTKSYGDRPVYWQGPSVGYDFGGEGSKVMVLVYNLRHPSDLYHRFGGVQGAAYVVGGISVQVQKHAHVTLAPIRAGVGLRLGANVGYLKYTRQPTWNPF
ncbi:MAG: DUF1134 domain-containing protein [Pseudomonadota bacterium]